MNMKLNLYDDEVYEQVIRRIEKLTPSSLSLWGKMTVSQMMAHCSEILDVYNGKKQLKTNLFARIFKGYIKMVIMSPEPYQKNSSTAPQFVISSNKDFEVERIRLLEAITYFFEMEKSKAKTIKHSLFGTMTLEERGWAMYKHLDHHLDQFGV